MKNYCIRILLFVFMFLNSVQILAGGCKNPVVISGNISDLRNGQNIEGAEISIEKNGLTIYSVQSDEFGNFVIKFEGQINRSDQIKISVFKNGYKIQTYKPVLIGNEYLQVLLDRKPRLSPMIAPAKSGLHEL